MPSFNTHVHVFPVAAILTPRAREVVRERLAREISDPLLSRLLVRVLRELLDELVAQRDAGEEHPSISEARLLDWIVEAIRGDDDFAGMREAVSLRRAPGSVESLFRQTLADLLVPEIRRALDWLQGRLPRGGGPDHEAISLFDLVETLRIMTLPTVLDVAERLESRLRPQEAYVVLTMDIGGADEDHWAVEEAVFQDQLDQTARLALARPGRALPFVAANPLRTAPTTAAERVFERLDSGLFVGVKLYPVLGYAPDHPELEPIWERCAAEGIPVLTHCSRGGFWGREEDRDLSDPARWEPILARHPNLVLCLAHFGGGGSFGEDGLKEDSWGAKVLELLRRHPNVYTDVAFHDIGMKDDSALAGPYFAELSRLLDDPEVGGKILYGTDYWVVRPRLGEVSYRRFYEAGLGAERFRRLSEDNPPAFLGLPGARPGAGADPANPCITDLVDRVVEGRDGLGAPLQPWLAGAVASLRGDGVLEQVEAATAAVAPAPRLRLERWRQVLRDEILDRTVADGLAASLDLEASRVTSPWEGVEIGLEADASVTIETVQEPGGVDADGIAGRPPSSDPTPGELVPPPILGSGGPWIKLRVRGRLEAGLTAQLAEAGLALEAEGEVVFLDYRCHRGDELLRRALVRDLSSPRFALDRGAVLALEEGEALALRTRGRLAGTVSLAWSDVLSAGASTLGRAAAAATSGVLSLAVETGASVSLRVEAADELLVIFAREGGRFELVVRKTDASARNLEIAAGARVTVDDPEALADLVHQLLARRFGAPVEAVRDLLVAETEEALESAGGAGLVEGLIQQGLAATFEEAREALDDAVESARDDLLELARTRLEAGFRYQWGRTENDAVLLQASLGQQALEELHPRLVQGDLDELVERARVTPAEVELVSWLGRQEVVRSRSWGFNLGPLGGADQVRRRFVRRRTRDGLVRPAFLGQRSYEGRWLDDETWRWRADFRAETEGHWPEAAVPWRDLRFGVSLLLEWDRVLNKTELREVLDAATLWGLLPEDGDAAETLATLEERFEADGLLRRRVRFSLETTVGHGALERLLPAAVEPLPEVAGPVLAAAMPWVDEEPRGSVAERRATYGPLWTELLERSAEPGFDLATVTRTLAQRASRQLRDRGLGRQAFQEFNTGQPETVSWRGNLQAFGGLVTLSPPVRAWRSFQLGLERLRRLVEGATEEESVERGRLEAEIELVFRSLEGFWRQTHHVRAAGAWLHDRARAVGVPVVPARPDASGDDAVTTKLVARWTKGGADRTRVVLAP